MAAPTQRDRPAVWFVDLKTGRVYRRDAGPCAAGGASGTLEGPQAESEAIRMTDEKDREQARKDLNPIEDIKGAIRYIKDLDPVEKVEEFMETAARVLEPSESDVRVVEPEDDTESEMEEPRERGDQARPREATPQPDVRQLNKEHRGY